MRKIIALLAFTFPVLIQAQDTNLKKEYKPKTAFSLVGGIQSNYNLNLSAPVYGVEISMECPLIQTQKSRIRQQFSLMRLEGRKYKSLAAEINPQFKIIDDHSFELGVGLSVGVVFTKAMEDKKALFSYGLGASFMYQFGKLSIGVESRYAITKKVAFSEFNKESTLYANLNNLRSIMKVGYKLHK